MFYFANQIITTFINKSQIVQSIMGRIRTRQAKRNTKRVLAAQAMTTSFEENKKILDSAVVTHSKRVRNVIAGYAAKLMRNKKAYE